MLVIGGAVLGAATGGLIAKKRGGSLADMLQYGAGYGIAFALVGLVATVLIERSMV